VKNRSLQAELEQLVADQRTKDELVRAKRAEKEEIEHKINDIRVELGQLQVRQQDLVERVRDELQIDLAEVFGSRTTGDVDWEEVRNEIAELRGKIERLGNVNLDAIDEQEGLEERHNFLTSQVEDLNASKTQLQQLINRLNKKSRERFAETFEQIRVNFQQIFRKLFGGGKADIVLEDADDILEAGIEVIARPPGKETRSISLLSGGEKSMTAFQPVAQGLRDREPVHRDHARQADHEHRRRSVRHHDADPGRQQEDRSAFRRVRPRAGRGVERSARSGGSSVVVAEPELRLRSDVRFHGAQTACGCTSDGFGAPAVSTGVGPLCCRADAAEPWQRSVPGRPGPSGACAGPATLDGAVG